MRKKNRFFAEEGGEAIGGGGAPSVESTGVSASVSESSAVENSSSDNDSIDWSQFDTENNPSIEGEFAVAEEPVKAVKEPEVAVKPVATPEVKAVPEVKTVPEIKPEVKAEAEPVQLDWAKWESDSIAGLVPQYQLTEDEANAMLTEPELVLPKLAASVHARVVKNILEHLPQILPNLLASTMQAQTVETNLRSQFFSVNDDLSDPKFAPAIQQAGAMFRQLNPEADVATASFQVGNMVRMAMGLAPKASAQNTPTPVAEQQVQQVQKPFTPAQSSAAGGRPATMNEFEALAMEILESDKY
jgi:hypothetical protein